MILYINLPLRLSTASGIKILKVWFPVIAINISMILLLACVLSVSFSQEV